MKISDDTLKIMKSFSRVNTNMLFNTDGKLRTSNMERNLVGVAEIEEKFPVEVPIYDLSQFINTIGLFEKPEFEFEDSYVVIKEENGKASCRYFYANPDTLDIIKKTPQAKPPVDEFQLTGDQMKSLEKASSVLGVNELRFECNGEEAYMMVYEGKTNKASNLYTLNFGKCQSGKKYRLNFKMDMFKLMGGDYTFSIAETKKSVLMQFQHGDLDLFYWVCPDPNSEYDVAELN